MNGGKSRIQQVRAELERERALIDLLTGGKSAGLSDNAYLILADAAGAGPDWQTIINVAQTFWSAAVAELEACGALGRLAQRCGHV